MVFEKVQKIISENLNVPLEQVSLSIIAFYIFKTIESKKFKQCKKY